MNVDDLAREMQLVVRARAAESRVSELERALEEAEKVIAPLAEYAAKYDTPEYDQFDWAAIAVGHLRAARKWMESRPSPPKEG